MASARSQGLVPSIGRERSPIPILGDRRSIDTGEQDIRVEDYLNDKIQTESDFDDLELLIANVENQRIQLQDQLEDAQSRLVIAKEAAATHTESMLQQVRDFQARQVSIDRRLQIVTSSDAPDEAVQRLIGPMDKLRRLQLAGGYVALLKEVDDLTDEARKNLPSNPKQALKPYSRLKQLSMSLRNLQKPADGAASHIVMHVEERAKNLWEEMKKIMSSEFELVLTKTRWPASAEKRTHEWSECFEKLLDLQTPELYGAQSPIILLPMSVLTKTFVQQFRYHFMGNRPTSSTHNPDYFFEWVLETISKWQDFLYDNVGPVLANHFRGSRFASNSLYTDPVAAFITAFLPIVQEKVDAVLLVVSEEPQSLSNFMVLLMRFDESIRKQFKYDGGDSKNGWVGLTTKALHRWFDRWLEVEREFALSRFNEIIGASDSGKIDYDITGAGKTKPTHGASKVTDLVGNVTQLYQHLRNFSWKRKFLTDIQIDILDLYEYRLRDSLNAYQAITSTIGRTLHGVTKEQEAALEGTGGLESLCKVYGSADHIISALQDWSSEVFFVDFWDEFQRLNNSKLDDNLASLISYTDVENSASTAVGSEEDDVFLKATIMAFQKLRDHAERLMVDSIKYGFPSTLRPYFTRPQWLTVDDDSDVETRYSLLSVTAELEQPLQALSDKMSFLHKALAVAPFRRIWREALTSLQDLLWNEVLTRQRFTTVGAAQFYRDLTAIWTVTNNYISGGSSLAQGMPRLREGVKLLNLPVVAQDGAMSVRMAYDRVFSNNQEAKRVIDELNFSTVTYTEARIILRSRVEANE